MFITHLAWDREIALDRISLRYLRKNTLVYKISDLNKFLFNKAGRRYFDSKIVAKIRLPIGSYTIIRR